MGSSSLGGLGLGFILTAFFFITIVNQFSVSSAFTNTHFLRRNAADKKMLLTTEEHWFDQILDHFSAYDHRKFSQRYYEFLDHFRSPDGPIFLKICGEAECRGISNDYVRVLARKFGAAIVTLEHRYYGKSSPFQPYTTENLRYLSSKQALFDLAAFRQYYQESLNKRLNRSKVENPWFVFGGSYAGALSAWFRLKFPHLTCGSLASSGVVLAVYNFSDFDRQVGISAGPECKAILQEVTQLVDERMTSNKQELKSAFDAAEVKLDEDFLYLLADAAATAFQYGNPDKVCSPLVGAKKAGRDLVDAYASYVKDYYLGTFGVDVAPPNDSIRSSRIDTKYHVDLCKNVFGDGVYPEVDATNLYYGGTKIAGSKIAFANGSQDPWRHASKQTSSPGLPSYIISCHNCGHCSDLAGCPQAPANPEGDSSKCSNPDAMNKARQQITENIDLWLSECQDAAYRGWSSV